MYGHLINSSTGKVYIRLNINIHQYSYEYKKMVY